MFAETTSDSVAERRLHAGASYSRLSVNGPCFNVTSRLNIVIPGARESCFHDNRWTLSVTVAIGTSDCTSLTSAHCAAVTLTAFVLITDRVAAVTTASTYLGSCRKHACSRATP